MLRFPLCSQLSLQWRKRPSVGLCARDFKLWGSWWLYYAAAADLCAFLAWMLSVGSRFENTVNWIEYWPANNALSCERRNIFCFLLNRLNVKKEHSFLLSNRLNVLLPYIMSCVGYFLLWSLQTLCWCCVKNVVDIFHMLRTFDFNFAANVGPTQTLKLVRKWSMVVIAFGVTRLV